MLCKHDKAARKECSWIICASVKAKNAHLSFRKEVWLGNEFLLAPSGFDLYHELGSLRLCSLHHSTRHHSDTAICGPDVLPAHPLKPGKFHGGINKVKMKQEIFHEGIDGVKMKQNTSMLCVVYFCNPQQPAADRHTQRSMA